MYRSHLSAGYIFLYSILTEAKMLNSEYKTNVPFPEESSRGLEPDCTWVTIETAKAKKEKKVEIRQDSIREKK